MSVQERGRRLKRSKGLYAYRPITARDKIAIAIARRTVDRKLEDQFRSYDSSEHITLLSRWACRHVSVEQYPTILKPLPSTADQLHTVKPTRVRTWSEKRGDYGVGYSFELPDAFLLAERRHFHSRLLQVTGRDMCSAPHDVHLILGWAGSQEAAEEAKTIFETLRPESITLKSLQYFPRSIERVVEVVEPPAPRQPIPEDFLAALHRTLPERAY